MRLPAFALTSTAQVLVQVNGAPDGLGQFKKVWAAQGTPVQAAHYPAGEKIIRLAQLRAVSVAREAYLSGSVNLNPQTNRLALDGLMYVITLVSEWNGFTVAGLAASPTPYVPDTGTY